MKKINVLLFNVFVIVFSINCYGQIVQGTEMVKAHIDKTIPIGNANGFMFYCQPDRKGDDLSIRIFKCKDETMEYLETKEVIVDFEQKGAYIKSDGVPPRTFIKNNKIYFFYCVNEHGDYHINLATIDLNGTLLNNKKIGVMIETGYEGLGYYYLSLSPDGKMALITLKNKCERKKAVGTNTTVNYENTELVGIDLINSNILFSKKIPIESDGFRIGTNDYIIDNDGKVSFIFYGAKRKKDIVESISGISIGSISKNETDLKLSEIDTKDSYKIGYRLGVNKRGEKTHIKELDKDVFFELENSPDRKNNYNFSFKKADFKDQDEKFDNQFLLDIYNADNNCTFVIYMNRDDGGFNGYYKDKKFSFAIFDKNGRFSIRKEIAHPYQISRPYYSYTKVFGYKNKYYLVYDENKPYELDEKNKLMIENKRFSTDDNFKMQNTVIVSIDSSGNIEKQVLNDNLVYPSNIVENDFVSEEGYYYTRLFNKKTKSTLIKKIKLN